MNERDEDQAKAIDSGMSQASAASMIAARLEVRLAQVQSKLDRREHQEIRESLTRLHAYAKLLQATDRQQFLQDELNSAAKQVQRIERRVGSRLQTGRQQGSGFSFGR
jgi:hypothetical protein